MGEPKEQFLEEAVKLHDAGVEGNKEAVQKAHALLQKLYRLDQHDPIVAAYYGSVTALLGRDAIDPLERVEKVMKGLKLLDGVVANHPANLTVRLLRAYLSYNLPEEFFHRTKVAIEDFQVLKTAYEADNSLLPQKTYWQILYDLGAACRRIGNNEAAQEVWRELLNISTDPKYTALIQAQD